MKKLLTIAIALAPFVLHAQVGVGANTNPNTNNFYYDNIGRTVPIKTNYEFFGTPYFGEEYCTAVLEGRGGKTYEHIKVKINLLDNTVLFVDTTGTELIAGVPIHKVRFLDCSDASKNKTLVTGMPPIDKQDGSSFYVVLDSGNVSLLKHIEVTFYDKQSNYSSATMGRYFKQNDVYYIYSKTNGITKIGKDNTEVISLFAKNKNELNAFIAKNNIKARKEEDLVRLFKYYNSLP